MSPPLAPLILASTSRYRKELLARLGLSFSVEAPGIEESARTGESPARLAARLAEAKARAVGVRHPTAFVVGSDQVAALGHLVLGKPGTRERAIEQLAASSGRTVTFHTAVTLRCPDQPMRSHVDETRVHFRVLSASEIERYVDLEAPFDCAGSFRSEGLGIALFESVDTHDPTALVGLPLIWLAQALRGVGLAALALPAAPVAGGVSVRS
jgi:septum formation protein